MARIGRNEENQTVIIPENEEELNGINEKMNVKAFFEALAKEEEIQQKLKEKEAAYTGAKEDREAAVKEILLPVAEEAGYAFTLDELKAYEESLQAEREISDQELESVSGGDAIGFCGFIGVGVGPSCEGLGVGCCFLLGGGPNVEF